MADYTQIVKHYDACLARHGDNHRGVDWPNASDVEKRYAVMLNVIRERDLTGLTLLDFGCGTGHLYQYLLDRQVTGISYHGLDMSRDMIDVCLRKFPETRFTCADILKSSAEIPVCDYVVMNGVFTEKLELSWDYMFDYFRQMVSLLFGRARIGAAFNVMSKHVDWERDDLFHVPFDVLAKYIISDLSRHFVIRNDYGLYEYTTYVYHEASL